MANRRRRTKAGFSRSGRLSPAESTTPQKHRSPLGPNRSHATPGTDSTALPCPPSTSNRASPLFTRGARSNSVSGLASALTATVHKSPYLASRCRTLKSQAIYLRQKFEELTAVIEELQPGYSAMDWAASAGTIVYVPVHVNSDNEAPRASPALPEVRGPDGWTFPDASQYFGKTDMAFGFTNAMRASANMGYEQMEPHPETCLPTSSS